MAMKMYKGDAECLANREQIPVLVNAGWSLEKPVPEAKTKAAPKPKAKPVEAPAPPAADSKEEAAKDAPKAAKVAPKKRRGTAKKK